MFYIHSLATFLPESPAIASILTSPRTNQSQSSFVFSPRCTLTKPQPEIFTT